MKRKLLRPCTAKKLFHVYDTYPYLKQSFIFQNQQLFKDLASIGNLSKSAAKGNVLTARQDVEELNFGELLWCHTQSKPAGRHSSRGQTNQSSSAEYGGVNSIPTKDISGQHTTNAHHFHSNLWSHFLSIQHPTTLYTSQIDHNASPSNTIAQRFQISFMKSSGPGGQHRNKTNSCVKIKDLVSGVHGEAAEDRNQVKNRKMAWNRLFLNMALKVRVPLVDLTLKEMREECDALGEEGEMKEGEWTPFEVSPGSEPVSEDLTVKHPLSQHWKDRVTSQRKLTLSPTSTAYAEIIADLLDIFTMHQWNLKQANEYLSEYHGIHVSSNQILNSLKKDKAVWAYVGQERSKLNLPLWK